METKEKWFGVIRDIAIAFIIVIIIICSLYAYTRNWPPMVVIESNSMMHSTNSELGVIDQGDLVLVKKINGREDIITYSEGMRKNYKTYGDFGDVIVYYKNGYKEDTPVIHRAIVWVEHNKTDPSYFDVPEWGIYHKKKITYNLPSAHVFLKDFIPKNSGFLTKGDNKRTNPQIDQVSHRDIYGRLVKPVRAEWVVGKARGELPWFGLIKLYLTGNENIKEAPSNSWVNLGISITLIIGVPIAIDTLYMIWENKKMERKRLERKRGKSKKEEKKELFDFSKIKKKFNKKRKMRVINRKGK